MSKQDVVYANSRILIDLKKKEGNFDLSCSLEETWGQRTKWNKLVTDWQIFNL